MPYLHRICVLSLLDFRSDLHESLVAIVRAAVDNCPNAEKTYIDCTSQQSNGRWHHSNSSVYDKEWYVTKHSKYGNNSESNFITCYYTHLVKLNVKDVLKRRMMKAVLKALLKM